MSVDVWNDCGKMKKIQMEEGNDCDGNSLKQRMSSGEDMHCVLESGILSGYSL